MPDKHTVHHKAKHTEKHASHKKKEPIVPAIIALIAIIVIVVAIINIDKILPKQSSIVAVIDGEKLTASDVDWRYTLVAQSQPTITKEQVLNSTIDETLLVQEAKKQGIVTKDSDVTSAIDAILKQTGMTAKQFEDSRNIKIDQLKSLYKNKMTIDSLIQAKSAEIAALVSDKEAQGFYDVNKEKINFTYADIKDQIFQLLGTQKYIDSLRAKASIQIFDANLDSSAALPSTAATAATGTVTGTFTQTNDPACTTPDGKPIIRLFSTTWCPHCNWVKDTYDKVVKEYVAKGKIVAYHWQLDTGDNTLTPEVEKAVPKSEQDLFSKYNPQGGVPTFLMACKYLRVGNGYEAQSDLKAEEAELRQVIDSLIADSSQPAAAASK